MIGRMLGLMPDQCSDEESAEKEKDFDDEGKVANGEDEEEYDSEEEEIMES